MKKFAVVSVEKFVPQFIFSDQPQKAQKAQQEFLLCVLGRFAMLATRSAKMSSEPTQEYSNEECLDPDYVNQEYVEIPDWHMAILQERLARYETEDRSTWRTWEEVERELLEEVAKSLTTKTS